MIPTTIDYYSSLQKINGPPPTEKSPFNLSVNFPPPIHFPSITKDFHVSQSIVPQQLHRVRNSEPCTLIDDKYKGMGSSLDED